MVECGGHFLGSKKTCRASLVPSQTANQPPPSQIGFGQWRKSGDALQPPPCNSLWQVSTRRFWLTRSRDPRRSSRGKSKKAETCHLHSLM